ncbi:MULTISPECIES: Bbp16 family capsid cement protein [unclassified Caballeronia]|uniref:Bbp16 family capsid cement protein n=1 Tax=unclassified Caballeronia TaxID=2646786 RepID=UPI001F470716|nr:MULTISPECIES: hypothetical protein [unclassified Caballeronia]MCE4544598.1 hypothetical protein [Caballeronia sp. PC1]MCE4571750.1 hypothetical protein [Caballeronia sp. CLC5]
MILDKTNEFSDSQAVTTTAVSTNVIDLNPSGTNPTVDIGAGEDTTLVLQTDAAATASGAATVTVTLESDTTTDLSSGSTNVHMTLGPFSLAQMAARQTLAKVRLPAGTYKRYLGVRYTVATGPLTGGQFSAFIVKDAQANATYKSGFLMS